MSMSEMGAIGICIDEYNGGEMQGRIYSSLRETPDEFKNVISMVKTINSIFDEGDYPQATMKCRGFAHNARPTEEKTAVSHESNELSKFGYTRSNIRGKKATFRVKVMFRQNASWQGTLYWVEKNREESFRSVLELMMLVDSSFDAERAAAGDFNDEKLSANM